MTPLPDFTPIIPLDVAALYVPAFGLFTAGALMARRRAAEQPIPSPQGK